MTSSTQGTTTNSRRLPRAFWPFFYHYLIAKTIYTGYSHILLRCGDMKYTDRLIRELEEAGTKVSSMFEPRVTVPGIGTIELNPEPIADKYGFGEKKDYRATLPSGYESSMDVQNLYKLLEGEHRVKIHEVTQQYLLNTFGKAYGGKDPAAWRAGDDIYVSRHDQGKELSYHELKAVLMHEIAAGYDHQQSEQEAQRGAINLLSPEGRYPDPTAHRKAVEFAPRVGLYNFSLN